LVPELRAHRSKVQGLETVGCVRKIQGGLTLDPVVSSPSDGYSAVKFTDSPESDPKPAAFDLVALLRSSDYAAGFARLQRTDALDSEDGTLVVNGFGSDPSALRAIFDSPEYLWASQVQNSLLSGYSRARGESVGLNDPVLRAALVDRLLVEVVTELRNRPNWLSVPLATLTLVLKGKPSREEETTESRPAWAEYAEAGSGAAEGSSASDDSDGAADAKGLVADDESSDAFALAPPADEAAAADSESVASAPRGASGSVAAAIANSQAECADSEESAPEEPAAASGAGEASESEPEGGGPEADEEEAEVPVRRVPASFAARGATSEDADSTGHESQPATPKDAPKLGHAWR